MAYITLHASAWAWIWRNTVPNPVETRFSKALVSIVSIAVCFLRVIASSKLKAPIWAWINYCSLTWLNILYITFCNASVFVIANTFCIAYFPADSIIIHAPIWTWVCLARVFFDIALVSASILNISNAFCFKIYWIAFPFVHASIASISAWLIKRSWVILAKASVFYIINTSFIPGFIAYAFIHTSIGAKF